ncbi:MAG: hypothetical protein ACXWVJ_03785 [Caulobacteraceae bacterium]
MDQKTQRLEGRTRNAGIRGLAWLGGAIAAAVATVVAAVLAVVFTVTLAVIALMSGLVIALGSLAWRAKRMAPAPRPAGDGALIEARNVGGHSWVAYGWDRQGR